MKLGPVTKSYKRNKTTPKKLDDDIMTVNCEVIVIFQIYSQFEACRILVPDEKVIFYFTKTKNLYHSSHTIALSKGTIFAKKYLLFVRICWHLQEGLGTKKYIYWNCIYVCTYTPMWVYLRTNFQVSSIILTSFRHREPCVCVCVCVLGWGEGGGRWWGERK